MAVDTTLISGAYKANKPTAGDLAGVNTIANITKGLTDRVDMYVKVQDAKHKMRNAEYDAYAQSVLDNSDLTIFTSKKYREIKPKDLVVMKIDKIEKNETDEIINYKIHILGSTGRTMHFINQNDINDLIEEITNKYEPNYEIKYLDYEEIDDFIDEQ